jgi:hypothetical protein
MKIWGGNPRSSFLELMNMIVHETYIKSSDEEFSSVVEQLKKKIVFAKKTDGKIFVSKLLATKGDILVFQTRNGDIVLNNIDEIVALSEYKQNKAVTE